MNEQRKTWAMTAVRALLSLAFAAGVLACTMVGAVVAHATVLGMDRAVGAVVLGALAALVLWVNRAQVLR